MKKFIATFWRANPRFSNGGYKTTRTIEAHSLKQAEKKAASIEKASVFRNLTLMNLFQA